MATLTHETFLDNTRQLHDGTQPTDAITVLLHLTIVGATHEPINQTPAEHIHGNQGCPRWATVSKSKKSQTKWTLDTFLKKAHTTHGNKYEYSTVKWTESDSSKTRVTINCLVHGEFTQTAANHVGGNGCPRCSVTGALSSADFIESTTRVHGDVYDYTRVLHEWTLTTKTDSKVMITCRTHGDFYQKIANHIHLKNGCPKCAKTSRTTQQGFLTKARTIHGDRYDYSSVEWSEQTNVNSKITITCMMHGLFTQNIRNHIVGKNGCPTCAGKTKLTSQVFVTRAREIHGTKYDYSRVVIGEEFFMNNTKLIIGCEKHGDFTQTAAKHINARTGCPGCKASKGEAAVQMWLDAHSIAYTPQKMFDGCINTLTGRKLKYDFYVPEHNTCIEFHGQQHYQAILIGNNDQVNWTQQQHTRAQVVFEEQRHRDRVKVQYCVDNDIKMLVIAYTEIKQVDVLLTNFFCLGLDVSLKSGVH
jgi:phage FluMu protein Com